jgi:hypothetical protein
MLQSIGSSTRASGRDAVQADVIRVPTMLTWSRRVFE